jgi:DNA-binding IclR family transcriptional regulator
MKTTAQTTISRFMRLLDHCATAPAGAGFEELRRALDNLPPGTMSRLLKAGVEESLLVHDDISGRYSAGPRLRTMAHALFGGTSRQSLIHEALQALSDSTGQPSLCVEGAPGGADIDMRFVDRVTVEGGVTHSEPGVTKLLLSQGFGFGLLLHYPADRVRAIVAEHTRRTGESASAIRKELDLLRRDRVLARAERYNSCAVGVTRVIAPVTAPQQPPLCIGVTAIGTVNSALTPQAVDTLKAAVRDAAHTLSQTLTTFHGGLRT